MSTLVLTWKLGLFADTGIASEQEWGINLKDEKTSESGVNAEGGSWYRESGEDLGENGYRCRWTVMGGRNADGSSEWKEAVGDKYFHHVFGVDKGGHFTSFVFEMHLIAWTKRLSMQFHLDLYCDGFDGTYKLFPYIMIVGCSGGRKAIGLVTRSLVSRLVSFPFYKCAYS